LIVLAIEALVLHTLRDDIQRVIQGTESAFEDLRLFSALLMRIEREAFSAPALREQVQRLSSHTLPASTTIGKLSAIVGFIEARRNIVLALLQVPLLYPLVTGLIAERWRKAHGAAVAPWIEVLGEIEALLSMAAYAYEHPSDPFPEVIDGPACFEAQAVGHPLIPAAQCVRNDVSICGGTRVLLVSGSNMSGKSTLLRTVGINTVLAMMGAPVRAASLRLTPLQVGASIRINDSLHEGSSRFYAEITRLKQLVLLMDGSLPLLFLLDELLQGTNSRDRRTGAEGIVRAFMERGAIGLISTHDLALTDFELPDAGALRNVHFEDAIVDGKMTFDFRLRHGVVTRSNGVELMRSIGLKV
jgi:DNA mismatch repair ATPase MutS